MAAFRAKPVFIFHAADDSTVPLADSERLADALKPAGAATKLVVVPTGGHYDSMITQGLPAAMAWLDELAVMPRATRNDSP